MLDASATVLFVEMNDRLRVRVSAESMTGCNQSFAQDQMIVDFPVEHDPYRAVFVAKRLISRGQIYDAEAADSQSDPAVEISTIVVRTAMSHGVTHSTQGFPAGR